MPALPPGQLCHSFAQCRSHFAALQRTHSAARATAGTAGLPCAQPLCKGANREGSFHPCSFPHRFDRGRKTFGLVFYVSIFRHVVNFESFLFVCSISFTRILFCFPPLSFSSATWTRVTISSCSPSDIPECKKHRNEQTPKKRTLKNWAVVSKVWFMRPTGLKINIRVKFKSPLYLQLWA